MSLFVPPGGVAGINQQTPAARAAMGLLRRATGNGTRKRRAKSKKRATATKRAKPRAKGRKLKFGSPAWRKKYMKKR